MAVELTAAEHALVNQKRKAQRPTYYNKNTGQEVNISEDFEKFLILLPGGTKKQAVAWITQSVSMKTRQIDRDLLLREAILTETEDTQAAILELAVQTTAFTLFRQAVEAGKFAEVGELGTMLSDLQEGLDEELLYEERMKHLKKLLTAVQLDLDSLGLSSDGIKQTQSWISPLLAY
jgi:hypothetical protein